MHYALADFEDGPDNTVNLALIVYSDAQSLSLFCLFHYCLLILGKGPYFFPLYSFITFLSNELVTDNGIKLVRFLILNFD